MKAHHYDASTGYYLGATDADADREQPGEWLYPAFSTLTAPPACPAGKVARFDRNAGAWSIVDAPPQAPQVLAPDEPPQPEHMPPTQEGCARMGQRRLLEASDWVSLRALDKGQAVPQEWREYRQALRDVDKQAGWPDAVVWPVAPGGSQ